MLVSVRNRTTSSPKLGRQDVPEACLSRIVGLPGDCHQRQPRCIVGVREDVANGKSGESGERFAGCVGLRAHARKQAQILEGSRRLHGVVLVGQVGNDSSKQHIALLADPEIRGGREIDSGDLRAGGEARHELSDLRPENSSEPDWKSNDATTKATATKMPH
jgi:hypothetical protein